VNYFRHDHNVLRLVPAARVPVVVVNLPQPDIETSIAVFVHSIAVSAGLVAHDALAIGLNMVKQT
jgi:hypothetical protein